MTSYSRTDTLLNRCCLQEDACREASTGWTCTSYYNNTLYAKYACPFVNTTCGTTDSYALSKEGDVVNISMSLQRGDVCFYKISSACGLPKIDLMDSPANVVIEYIQFEAGSIATDSLYTHGTRGGAPDTNMPWRTETFVYPDQNKKIY